MAKLNYDITRRSEAARKSCRRAESKLAKQFNDAGGLEAEMRIHLAEMKREQIQLKKELANLKFQSRKSAREDKKRHGVIHHAEPDMTTTPHHESEFMNDVSHHLCGLPKKSEYGKNFFGYHSAPGSNKTHNRSVKDIEMSLDNYFHKVEDEESKEKTKRKLILQREQNKEVEVKLKEWKKKNPSRRKLSIREPPNLRHLSMLKEELMHKDMEKQLTNVQNDSTKSRTSETYDRPTSEALTSSNKSDDAKSEEVFENESKNSNKSESNKSSNKENSKETIPLLRIAANNDHVFDAELYAPDGGIRMAHRMPEFQVAFAEAGRARYVRTKYKREFERQLSNSQIFIK